MAVGPGTWDFLRRRAPWSGSGESVVGGLQETFGNNFDNCSRKNALPRAGRSDVVASDSRRGRLCKNAVVGSERSLHVKVTAKAERQFVTLSNVWSPWRRFDRNLA